MGCSTSKLDGEKKPSALSDLDEIVMKEVGMASVDGICTSAETIINNLAAMNGALVAVITFIRKLLIEVVKIMKNAGKYIADFIKDVAEKAFTVDFELLMQGKSPISFNTEALSEAGGPPELLEQAKGALESMTTACAAMVSMPTDIEELVTKAKDLLSDPSALMEEAKGAASSPLKIPGMTANAKKNLQSVSELPSMLTTVKNNAKQTCTEIDDIINPTVDKAIEQCLVESKAADKKDLTVDDLLVAPLDETVACVAIIAPLYKKEEATEVVTKLTADKKDCVSIVKAS
jgi:hypothetical protein